MRSGRYTVAGFGLLSRSFILMVAGFMQNRNCFVVNMKYRINLTINSSKQVGSFVVYDWNGISTN